MTESKPAPVTLAASDPLPLHIEQGLHALRTLGAPKRLAQGSAWSEVVADAERLARDGWARKALALGWHPLELFGCGRRNSGEFESLAVWLAGGKVALIDGVSAIAMDGRTHRVFNRRRIDVAEVVFLWDLGRGR